MNPKVCEYTAVIMPADKGGAFVAFPYDVRAEFGKGRVKVHLAFDGEPYDGSIVNSSQKSNNEVYFSTNTTRLVHGPLNI